MKGPRAVRPEEYQETIELLNSVFRQSASCTMEQEYPVILGRSNMENMRVIVEDGHVVSHAAIYPVDILLDGLKLRMAGVGSVATHPRYRNRSYATAVLCDCLKQQKNVDCDFSVLWTAIPDFYRRLGYEKAGSELIFYLRAEALRDVPSPKNVVEYSEDYLDAIMDIHNQCPSRVVRSREEYARYFRLPRSTTILLKNRGKVVAYLVAGKGEDLANCVHEWGGSTDDLLPLVKHAIALSGRRALSVMSPERSALTEALMNMRVPFVRKEVGMVKIVNVRALSAKLFQFYRSVIPERLTIDWENGKYVLRAGEESLAVEDEGLLVRLVFGSADKSAPPLPVPIGSVFRKIFPLPFFIWGLDSV